MSQVERDYKQVLERQLEEYFALTHVDCVSYDNGFGEIAAYPYTQVNYEACKIWREMNRLS